MSSYYIKQGASGGDGSQGSPFGSFSEMIGAVALSSGDDVNISNLNPILEGEVTFTNMHGVHFRTWDESGLGNRWGKLNALSIEPTIVHDLSGTFDVYKTATGAVPPETLGITENWYENKDANGNRYGFLLAAGGASALTSERGHDINPSQLVKISVPDGESPVGRTYLALQPGHGIVLINCTNNTFEKGTIGLCTEDGAGNAYGILEQGTSSGNQYIDMEFDGCQWHGIGINSNTPTARVIRPLARSAKRGNDGHFVVYSTVSPGKVTIEGGESWPCPWLDVDQQPVNEWQGITLTGGVSSFAAHNVDNATAGFSNGSLVVTKHKQHPNTYLPARSCAFATFTASSVNQEDPANLDDPNDYPIQFIDCEASGNVIVGGGSAGSTNGINKVNIAFVRPKFNIDGSDPGMAPTPYGGFIQATCSSSAAGMESRILMVSPVIEGVTNETALEKLVSNRVNGSEIRLINPSMRLNGTYSGVVGLVRITPSSGMTKIVNGVLSAEDPDCHWMRNAGGVDRDKILNDCDIKNNMYDDNMSDDYNGSSDGIDRTWFESVADPDGQYGVVAEFDDNSTLEPAESLKALKNATATEKPDGVNGLPNSNQYGAWQFGSLNTRGIGRRRSRRAGERRRARRR